MNEDDFDELPEKELAMTATAFHQTLLKRLAAIAVAVGTAGSAQAAEELASIPQGIAEALVDAVDEWSARDRSRLLNLMARDPRPSVRKRVARRLGDAATLDDDGEELLYGLGLDPSPEVRDAVQHTLARLVPKLTALERSSVIGHWATSPHATHRLLTARVLRERFPLLWVDEVVALLARDPSPSVRRAAHEAAEARGMSSPQNA